MTDNESHAPSPDMTALIEQAGASHLTFPADHESAVRYEIDLHRGGEPETFDLVADDKVRVFNRIRRALESSTEYAFIFTMRMHELDSGEYRCIRSTAGSGVKPWKAPLDPEKVENGLHTLTYGHLMRHWENMRNESSQPNPEIPFVGSLLNERFPEIPENDSTMTEPFHTYSEFIERPSSKATRQLSIIKRIVAILKRAGH